MGYIAAMSPLQLFFAFDGRIGRGTWWCWGVLALLLLGLVGFALLGIAGLPPERAQAIVDLLLLWPTLAISAKRWHDRGKSAWWLLVALLPVVGWLWVVAENGLLPGQPTSNRYGRAAAEPAMF